MEENLDFSYVRIANRIRHQVLQGIYKLGAALPRQRDLAALNNVALATLKKSLDILEREGYVVRKNGRGTYATLPEDHRPTALIVDDEAIIRTLISEMLVNHGWLSLAVESGDEALEQLEGKRFDLIFLDLVMPGMNGARAFQKIRTLDPDAKVVIITGNPDSDLMADALQVGPFAVMNKPFGLDQLRVILGYVPFRAQMLVPNPD